ncbi:hypothetical protein B0H13DRAFT_1867805 [Mycena leptocephala]|nr:hypothetical protein B0H13DRAFT_1867805 [Mycena leptocephala]
MKFSSAFIAFAPLVAALPSLSTVVARDDTPLTPGNLFVCTEAGFTGLCQVFSVINDQCFNFPPNFMFDISAVGPDQGQSCFFFMQVPINANCVGPPILGPITFPGISDLSTQTDPPFDNLIESTTLFEVPLVSVLVEIAKPPLGTGFGGLEWVE